MRKAATKTKSPKKTPEKSLGEHMAQRLREGFLIFSLAIAIYLLLALITYHASDPGWSFSSGNQNVQNAGGRVGAWFADVFLYIFGYSAYLFPVLLAYGSWSFYQQRLQDFASDHVTFGLRCLGFFLIFIAASGLSSLYLSELGNDLPYTAGGILGNLMGPYLVDTFSASGTTLLLIALFLSGITLFTGLSWLGIMELLGRGVFVLSAMLYQQWRRLLAFIKQQQLQRKEDRLEAELRQPEVASSPRTKPTERQPRTPTTYEKIERVEPTIEMPVAAPTVAKPVKKKSAAVPAKVQAVSAGALPSLDLLDPVQPHSGKGFSKAVLQQLSEDVEARLKEFNVTVTVVAVQPGPVITRFELDLAPGVKVSKITGLAKDLARSLSVISVRVVEVIPGKSVIGIEIPNAHREIVQLRDVLESQAYQQPSSALTMALGHDIGGNPVVVDLAKMPHLLVAGTTGSGKSVGLNAMLLSILYKATPQQVRMILIDPKMLELSIYEGIPHLLTPVVVDMKEAANALRWCVAEMDRRYRLMAALGVRNLAGYNAKVEAARAKGEPLKDPVWQPHENLDAEAPDLEELPCIMVLVDEFADMIMVVGKKVEELIARIAQKARAAGIHLILATQRPSVDVITGLIKANVPTRIAFQVSSRVDSRTILDQQGAEQLLGHGDMLYLAPGTGVPTRVHGAYVADQEVHNVVDAWKQAAEPNYLEEILEGGSASTTGIPGLDEDPDSAGDKDALYDQAVRIVTETRRASISNVQRRLKIGYNRAARIVEEMEVDGVVSPMENNGSREVLAPPPPPM